MVKKSNLAVVNHALVNKVLAHLKAGAVAAVNVAAEANEVGAKRVGAYTHYVTAGITAGSAAVLEAAAVKLFDMIRKTGKVGEADLHCRQGKDAKVFLIPSSISAAKSYVSDALASKVPFVDEDGAPRPFSGIRADVMKLKQVARMASLKGIDLIRSEIHKQLQMVAAVTDDKEANVKDLEDLLSRLQATYKDYGFDGEVAAQASEEDAVRGLVDGEDEGDDEGMSEQGEDDGSPVAPAKLVVRKGTMNPRRRAAH